MSSQSMSRHERERVAGEELADEIDAVSYDMAERVLGRAIKIDSDSQAHADAPRALAESIDYETLTEIAAEVGVPEEAVRKALLEELDTEKDHGAKPLERLTAPDTVRGGIVVEGSVEELAQRLERALGRDRHVHVESVPQRRGDRHLVAIGAKTARARRVSLGWIIALFFLSPVLFNLVGLAFLAATVVGVGVIVGWAKRFARKARRTINRVLGQLVDEGGTEPDSWLDVWERHRRRM